MFNSALAGLFLSVITGYVFASLAGLVLHLLGVQGYWADELTTRALLFAAVLYLASINIRSWRQS